MRVAETKRTVIDRIEMADAEFFARLLNSPGWKRFISDRGTVDRKTAEEYLREKMIPVYERHGFGYYVIRTRVGESIGICGFLKKPHLDHPDFGFALLPEHHRLGLAHEAAVAVFEFGQAEFGFEVLDAEARAENEASIRLLEKLGFHEVDAKTTAGCDDESLIFRWRRT